MIDNPRPAKVAVVEEIRDKLAQTEVVFVTEYRGLKVADLQALRAQLRTVDAEYKVFKNTLTRIAAKAADREVLVELLSGPSGLVFSGPDAAATAKGLRDFSRINDQLVVKGALMGSQLLDQPAVFALASLPSRDVLLAQVAGVIAAPMVNFASALNAVPRDFAYGLKALIDQREAA
ncbi:MULTISPECIES: 50S ribosomal protein L10 [Ferrimicrobium]|jgi:large subunit ribosomal protein L10|nr:50S ribosomal protein L10 [Ferrimicrobium sp.]MCL5973411.1 50S ribosomal protein L10 [Actinomycetota bacterium]